MATAPATTFSSRSNPAKKWVVRLGDATGATPMEADETMLLRWPVITIAPGSRGTFCQLDYNLGKEGERIVDTYLKAGFARQVEIVQPSEDPDGPDTLLFWGEISSQQLAVNPKGESVTLRATIEDYHFGGVCLGPKYRDPEEPHGGITYNDPIVFNPEINGIVQGNMANRWLTAELKNNAWIHDQSSVTDTALTSAQDEESVLDWELVNCVNSMQWLCNPDETYIKNPPRDSLQVMLADAPSIKNLELPTGKYLPEYLDLLLTPYGYSWCLTFKYNAEGDREVSYRIFKVNEGDDRKLLQQRPGDTRAIRRTLTNIESFTLETGIVAQANKVTVLGDYEEYEVTIELYRGWPEADDALTAADLTQSTGSSWSAHQRAWRLWVANEAGDYCGTRTTVKPIPSTPLDLTSVLGTDFIPRRLKPMDCLTYWVDDTAGETERRRPPFIQWYNEDSEWAPLPDGWGETVLNDQLGVMFAADSPPTELIDRGANARIRITCTIQSFNKLVGVASRASSSVNLRTHEIVVNAADRYKYKQRATLTYASILTGNADERDDTTAIEAFAEKMRAIEDAAMVRGNVVLNTLNTSLKIGDVVTEIDGRDVSLNRMAKTSATKKYVQIVAIEHDHQRQKTSLKVAPIMEAVT